MSTDTTTRRGLLRLATGTLAYGAGAAAVAGAGFAISEAKGTTPDRTEWVRLVGELEAANARAAADCAAFNVCEARYVNQKPSAPKPPKRDNRVKLDMTLAEIKALPVSPDDLAYEQAQAAWKARREALYAELVEPAEATWNASLAAVTAAVKALLAYPAPTAAMYAEKIDLIATAYHDDLCDEGLVEAIVAEARRLAKQEGR